jgi:hypothetical protein
MTLLPMNKDSQSHHATPEQWACIAHHALLKVPGAFSTDSCILELRARIEALEAAQQDKLDRLIALDTDPAPDAAMTDYERVAANMATCPSVDKIPDFTGTSPTTPELPASSAEARPAGLVERVALAIDSSCPQDEYVIADCRAAIREVAAWLETESEGHLGSGKYWATRLRSEADRG